MLQSLYDKKYNWQMSQIKNIDYLFERYCRIQHSIYSLQAELSDIKSVFKVYFDQGGRDIEATSGEVLTQNAKYTYSYDFDQVRQILQDTEMYERAFKLNNGLIDRLINSSSIDEEIKQRLSLARTKISETKSIVIQQPDKSPIQNQPR